MSFLRTLLNVWKLLRKVYSPARPIPKWNSNFTFQFPIKEILKGKFIVGTQGKGRGGWNEISNFLKKRGGGGFHFFFHKKGGVGEIGELF